MSSDSPMIDRMRGSKRTPTIPRIRMPKKGVIRVILTLVILFAAYKITGSLPASSSDSCATKKNDSTRTSGAKPSAGPFPVDLAIGDKLDFKEVADLLALAPPRMTGAADTVVAGKDSLVRCFSLDTSLQKIAATLFRQYKPLYATATIIHPKTGRVLALVTYRHDSARVLGDLLCLRSFLPAASIFKTITAAAAIEKAGYSDSTSVPVAGRNHTLYRFQLKKEIDPWNQIPFGDAYARSINPVFARIGMHVVGQKTLKEYGERFGFNAGIPFEIAVDPSCAEIPFDTTYEMAEVASGFNRKTSMSALHGALIAASAVTGGIMPEPRFVDSIVSTTGACLYKGESRPWKDPVCPATAGELRILMDRVVEQGTARKSFRTLKRCGWSAGVECGGKTGSINVDTLGKIDWFIGYAVDRADPESSLAIAVATVHGTLWTVHSAYIAAEIIRNHFRPMKTGNSTRQLTIPVKIDSTDTSTSPGG